MPDDAKVIKNLEAILAEFGIKRDAGEMWEELKALDTTPKPKRNSRTTPAYTKLQKQLQARGVDISKRQLTAALPTTAERRKQQKKHLEKLARAAKRKQSRTR